MMKWIVAILVVASWLMGPVRAFNPEIDSEVDGLLNRARQHIADRQWREALVLVQNIVDRPGQVLSSGDGRVYRPARAVAEEMLAKLPAEGLAEYRLAADAMAKGLVGNVANSTDAAALEEATRRYFFSSHGDDAAFRLGCLYLDRHEFPAARRLFLRVLRQHPDPSAPREQVLVRLAVACIRMRDEAAAKSALDDLKSVAGAKLPAGLVAALEQELAALPTAMKSADLGTDWPMEHGTPSRQGRAAGLPEALVADPERAWVARWEYAVKRTGGTSGMPREVLVEAWQRTKQFPPGSLARLGDRLFVKCSDRLVACDVRSGQVVWETVEMSLANGNRNPALMQWMNSVQGDPSYWMFASRDRLGAGMLAWEGRLFHIEHMRAAMAELQMGTQWGGWAPPGRRGAKTKPAGGCVLSALDAMTGKRLWQIGREEKEARELGNMLILAAPTPCAGRIVMPVAEQNELVLVALDPATGKPAWKTFLCGFGLSPQAFMLLRPLAVAVDGNEVFVATGRGLVFALDGQDGQVLWASRYDPNTPRAGAAAGQPTPGWADPWITVWNGRVVALPGDAQAVLMFDRLDGRALSRTKVNEPAYCLGLSGNVLQVVASQAAYSYELPDLKMAWRAPLSSHFGRGVVAGGHIFLPSGRGIVCLDAATGRRAAEFTVMSGEKSPVGNLLVSGDTIYTADFGRVQALVHSRTAFEQLNARLAAQPDPQAYFQRSLLHRRSGRARESLDDLRLAYAGFTDAARKEEARVQLLDDLLSLNPPALEEAAGLTRRPVEATWVKLARARLDGKAEFAVADVEVIGVYEGTLPPGVPRAGNPTGAVTVRIGAAQKAKIIVLTAYEPVVWTIEDPGGVVVRVIASGCHEQTVKGLDKAVPVTLFAATAGHSKDWFFAYKKPGEGGSDEAETRLQYERLARRVKELTKQDIKRFQGSYTGSVFDINGP